MVKMICIATGVEVTVTEAKAEKLAQFGFRYAEAPKAEEPEKPKRPGRKKGAAKK